MKFQEAVRLGVKLARNEITSEEKRALGIFFVTLKGVSQKRFEKAVTKALEVRNRPGCVELRQTRQGVQVGLYRSLEAGIETDPDYPWSTVCEPHGGVVCHETRELAEAALSHPDQWCPVCQGHEEAPSQPGPEDPPSSSQ